MARFELPHKTSSCIIKYIGPWKKENILRNVGHSLHTYMADAVAIHCIRSTWKFQILNNLRVYSTGNNYLLRCKKCGTECLWSYTDTVPSSEFCHYTKGVIRVLIAFRLCIMVLMVLCAKMFESLTYLSSAAISAWTNLIHVWVWQNGRDRNHT
jgi:hypothetical protein